MRYDDEPWTSNDAGASEEGFYHRAVEPPEEPNYCDNCGQAFGGLGRFCLECESDE